MKKRKATIKRSKVFQIALKGEGNGNFAWECFDHSLLLPCQIHHSVNIDKSKLAWHKA